MPKPKPAVVIVMEGGVIQEIATTTDMDVLVIDYDVDTLPEDERSQVIQSEATGKKEDAYLFMSSTETAPQYVRWRLRNYRRSDGKEC